MFYYDWTALLLIPAFIVTIWAQIKVQSTFKRYSKVDSRSHLTGAEVAQKILDANGIHGVRIEPTQGSLTDHFDPKERVVRLSETVYDKTSIAAIGVAAHEVGHVIQHEQEYGPIKVRSALVPVAQVGSYFAWILLLVGLVIRWGGLIELGIILFLAVVLFQLVTLPVEFNASRRALAAISEGGYLDSDEIKGSRKVLSAAAMTYVAALIVAILQLARMILILADRR